MRKWGHARQRRPGPNRPWTAYWSENGRRLHQSGFPTEEDAERFLREKRLELEHGLAINPSDVTVADYVALWIKRRRHIAPATVISYESQLRNNIAPGLGSVRVQELTGIAIDTWIGELVDKGLSPTTARLAFTVLKAALADAVGTKVIRENPADSPVISLPKRRQREVVSWTEEEVQRFVDVASGHELEALFRFMLASQLRLGEALALPWSLVNLNTGEIHVHWNRRQHDGAISEVKTARSRRRVVVDGTTTTLLQAHRDRLTFERRKLLFPGGEPERVFVAADGHTMVPSTIRRELARLCKQASITRLTPHGLRHTGATLLLKAGVPLHVVSRRLGHSSAAFTADVYAHVLPSQEADAAALLEALMDERKTG